MQRPEPSRAVETTCRYLAHIQFDTADLRTIRDAVERHTSALAARRITPVGAERLGRALERERLIDPAEVNSISHAIHGMIAEIAGNRFLHFCIEVLTQLTSVNVDRSRVSTDLVKVQDEVNLIHSRIVKAIVHSDADRAAALMGGISRRSRDSSRFDVGASMPRTAEVHLLEVSDRHRVDGPCDELVVPLRHRNLIVRGDSGGRVAGAGR